MKEMLKIIIDEFIKTNHGFFEINFDPYTLNIYWFHNTLKNGNRYTLLRDYDIIYVEVRDIYISDNFKEFIKNLEYEFKLFQISDYEVNLSISKFLVEVIL